jgi:hypothetical protein
MRSHKKSPLSADRELATVRWVLLIAIAVSIVHYTDNYLRFDTYVDKTLSLSDPGSGGTPSIVTETGILVSWFLFTAAGIAGYRALRRERRTLASGLLGFYSVSGLLGWFHYGDVPPGDFDLYQNAVIVADGLLGIAMAAIAFSVARAPAAAT